MIRCEMIRCERWSKTGAFQRGGTGRWEQCKNRATMRVHIKRGALGDWRQNQPICDSCYKLFVSGFYRPHKVLPLHKEGGKREMRNLRRRPR